MFYFLMDRMRSWLSENGLYRYAQILDQEEFRVFAAGLTAFCIVLVFGRRFVAWLMSKKIGDQAKFDVAALDKAMASKANTPTMGGLLIAGAIGGAVLLFADLSNSYVQMAFVVLVWLTAVGSADDWLKLTAAKREGSRQGLYAWEKLVFQLGLGLVIGYFAYQAPLSAEAGASAATAVGHMEHVVNLPFFKTYEDRQGVAMAGMLYHSLATYTIVMVLMMAGMSNAVNITDGMDGLASGVTAIVALGIVVLALIAGSSELAWDLLVPYVWNADELAVVAAAMMGACLGFLWWNASPAAMFMGDTGSLCLGGLIGFMAVVVRQEIVVLVACGVFLIEIGSVVLQVGYFKATKGERIFRCAPYHWHLHMGGWPEQKIVARFWILTVILTAAALGSLKLR